MDKKDSTPFFKKITYTDGIYPTLKIEQNITPNKLFAFPIIGILIKLIVIIPIFIEFFLLTLWLVLTAVLINPFFVLFTGKYWPYAHTFTVGFLRLSTKVTFYLYGLTDKYPGFSLKNSGDLTFDMPVNQSPNKLFAIPILGGLIRFIFLIPYFIFTDIISQAATIGALFLAWAVVLFKGRYPAGIFELAKDSGRINAGSLAYLLGLSDKYPSFYFSMAHDKIKLILIAISIIFSGWNYTSSDSYNIDEKSNFDYQLEQKLQMKEYPSPNTRTD